MRLLNLNPWKYFDNGTTKQCRITGTIYFMDYRGKWVKGNKETQRNFNLKR